MKLEFLNYDAVQLNLPEVLALLDEYLASCPLPRDKALAFHVAIQQVLPLLKGNDVKEPLV